MAGNWLAAGLKGAADAGGQYTQKLISENMQKRRDERLAGIRRGETKAYQKHEAGLLDAEQTRSDKLAADKRSNRRQWGKVEGMPGTMQNLEGETLTQKKSGKGTAPKIQVQKVPDPNNPELEIIVERLPDGQWRQIDIVGSEQPKGELSESELLIAKEQLTQGKDKDWIPFNEPSEEEVRTHAYKIREGIAAQPEYTTKEDIRSAMRRGEFDEGEAVKRMMALGKGDSKPVDAKPSGLIEKTGPEKEKEPEEPEDPKVKIDKLVDSVSRRTRDIEGVMFKKEYAIQYLQDVEEVMPHLDTAFKRYMADKVKAVKAKFSL